MLRIWLNSAWSHSRPCVSDLEVAHEISRVVRVSSIAEEFTPSQSAHALRRLDTCAAFAVVVLASSSVLCAAVWMIEHWQLS